MPGLFADLSPLRESVPFRWLWAGQALSVIGSTMTGVAVAVQVYELTRSSAAVGAVSLAGLIPTLLLGLFGGSLADAVDRRKLVAVTSSGLMLVAVVFALQAWLDWGQLWLLYLLTATSAALASVDAPARRTFVPRLLPPERIPAAAALHQLSFQVALIGAPLLAGVLITAAGLEAAYAIDALTFGAVLVSLRHLPPMPPAGGGTRISLRSVAEGIRYAARHQPIGMVFLLDLTAMVLALPTALFPALADTHFGGGAQTISYLYAAVGVGGLTAAVLSGPLNRLRRRGRAMFVSVTVWSAAVGAIGLSRELWIALGLLAVAGAADIVTTVFRATILQTEAPDDLLGRLNSLDFIVGVGGPNLGNLRAGALASATGPVPALLVSSLAAMILTGMLALTARPFWRYVRS